MIAWNIARNLSLDQVPRDGSTEPGRGPDRTPALAQPAAVRTLRLARPA
jgi:hypothetical protein